MQVTHQMPTEGYFWTSVPVTVLGLGLIVLLALLLLRQNARLRAVRHQLEQFRVLAEHSPALMYHSALDGLRYLNRAGLAFFGTTFEALAGSQWRQYIHPEDIARFYQDCHEAARNEAHFQTEVRVRRHDDEYRWLLVTGSPVYGAEGGRTGKLTGYTGVAFDITERKAAEEAIRENQKALGTYALRLEQSNRDLEHFAFIASHDLQAPLRKVQFFSDMLLEFVNEEGRDVVDRLKRSTVKMQDLISDLLTLSRISRHGGDFQQVPLRTILTETIDDLELAIEETGGRVELQGAFPIVQADARQLQQVFSNLIGNALKFRKQNQPAQVTILSEVEGDCCRITVTDDGIGFQQKYADKIFGIFERLHADSNYSGTGMGLAIVQKIIERHGGSIRASSEPGHGAAFFITLPINQSNPSGQPGPEGKASAPRKREESLAQ